MSTKINHKDDINEDRQPVPRIAMPPRVKVSLRLVGSLVYFSRSISECGYVSKDGITNHGDNLCGRELARQYSMLSRPQREDNQTTMLAALTRVVCCHGIDASLCTFMFSLAAACSVRK